jgi:hypothetical protein
MPIIQLRFYFIFLLVFTVSQSQNTTSKIHLIIIASEKYSNLPKIIKKRPSSETFLEIQKNFCILKLSNPSVSEREAISKCSIFIVSKKLS